VLLLGSAAAGVAANAVDDELVAVTGIHIHGGVEPLDHVVGTDEKHDFDDLTVAEVPPQLRDQFISNRIRTEQIQLREDQCELLVVGQIRTLRMIDLTDLTFGQTLLLSLSKPDVASKFATGELRALQAEQLA
jgi:hypothetical protein